MQRKTFFVSFWHLCLENLTEGSFSHRHLSPEQAKALIEQAQHAHTLMCVAKDDLFAPYHQKDVRKYRELCSALQVNYEINLSLQDFVLGDEGSDFCSINPLQFAQVEGATKLLVITCAYTVNKHEREENTDTFDIDAMLAIAPDSLEFHLIEAISAP